MSAAEPIEDEASEQKKPAPFVVRRPRILKTPLIFASPHSGRVYPQDLMAVSRLDARDIRRSEDALVDRLLEPAGEAGAAVVLCQIARAYVDVNRDPWEMDPAMFADEAPAHARSTSARVAAGLGSVPRVVGDGQPIYARKIRFAEAEARIETVHGPWHQALTSLLEEARARFGLAVLIDWHSMPSAAGKAEARRGRPRPDIVLGDRHGDACSTGLSRLVRREFELAGYVVSMNRPYAGGWTTQIHGRPSENVHALQVEIDRSLYLDERILEPGPGYPRLQQDLSRLFETLSRADWPELLRL